MWDDNENDYSSANTGMNVPGRTKRPINTLTSSRQPQSQLNASVASPRSTEQPENSSAFLPYRCIPPSSEKRQQLLQAEQRGEEMYQQYRNSSRLGYVSESNQLGGGNVREDDARRKAQQQQNRAKMDRLRKQEELKEQKRRQEEEESARIKAEGHRKAELLEQKKRQEAERQANLHHEQHKRTNDKFLAKFEQQSFPASTAATVTPASATLTKSTIDFSARAFQPDHRDVIATHSASQLRSRNSSAGLQPPSVTDSDVAANVPVLSYDACSSEPQKDSPPKKPEARQALLQLRQLYPLYDIEVLQDILEQTNYNVIAANRLLSD